MPARRIAVLFDLDGTLLDTVGLILSSVRHAFAGYAGRCPTDAEWIAGIGMPLRVQVEGFALRPEDVEPLVARYRDHQREHQQATRCFPGAREVVAALKERGHPIGVVTAKHIEPALRALGLVGLAPFVDTVVGADSCDRHKPDPAPVLLALERLGRAPPEAIFVGDSPHDVAAGNGAGVATAAALWGACSREVLLGARPGHLLASLDEVPAIVERLEAASRDLLSGGAR